MFEPRETRLFGLPCGAGFARELVRGLRARMQGQPPEAMARVELYLNSGRMLRQTRAAFAEEGALILPRLRLVSDLGAQTLGAPPIPALRRKLELAELIASFTATMPDFASGANIYTLAESLSALLAEMQSEGVAYERLSGLPIAETHAVHWQRSLAFISIVAQFYADEATPNSEARQRAAAEALAQAWAQTPPQHPILVAGSTGSRGATALFMQAVARLPQGAVILPGVDFSLPSEVWRGLSAGAVPQEDHPQYRFKALFDRLEIAPDQIQRWTDTPEPARNAIVSLALRPAPVTDQWIEQGKSLPDLADALGDLTLIEAPDQRREAMAVALVLRAAVAEGKRAALVTPDRILARRVAAALERWSLIPDDSAGEPLPLTAVGRFLRQCARALTEPTTIENLLILLKHPLAATGAEARGQHLLFTRELELHLRRKGPAFPTETALNAWAARLAERSDGAERADWARWLGALIAQTGAHPTRPMADWQAAHLAFAEGLAAGPQGTAQASELWRKEGGQQARAIFAELAQEARGTCSGAQYCDLVMELLQGSSVRVPVEAHPDVAILGALEVRGQAADVMVLAGLNEGVWPAAPAPDPWLSRQMRLGAGLLLPERQIGLSAHDFQIAMGAKQVVLSRSERDASAPTVRSRWLNRLVNLMNGLPEKRGPEAFKSMKEKGNQWLARVQALEATAPIAPAQRPAPAPPVEHRPRELPVTDISRLIRMPYDIYAKRVLRLRPLDPIRPDPDARMRGQVLHLIAEQFAREISLDGAALSAARLIEIAEEVLVEHVPWPLAQRVWLAQIRAIAESFTSAEVDRRAKGVPVVVEEQGAIELVNPPFRLTAKPDRIDLLNDGTAHVFDYKSGKPPSLKLVKTYEKQLVLEALMVERGGFKALGPRKVEVASYLRLGGDAKVELIEVADMLDETWRKLKILIARYLTPEQGYTARRAPQMISHGSDYDRLSRYGEWQDVDPAVTMKVGE